MNKEQPDPIAEAFEKIRAEAVRRTGRVPDSAQRAFRHPRSASGMPARPRQKGMPTGRDGRRRPPARAVESLGSVLDSEIVKRGWQRELASGWIHGNWDVLVGEKVANHTRVEMIKEKTLFISCDSTAWATNLRMMQRQILQVIAEKVGPDVISELKIFGPKAPSWRKGPLHVKGRGPRDTYG